ncbi:hypothetical protein ACFYN0_23460 [Streptomyces sp. NPDC006704]|uniref:hypothetical protein n=1 Tax=Streptomyces sp. NPDC006704 TaxID=3364760 RepID=UPI003684F2FD
MTHQLTAYEALVFPDYGAFELFDADCDAHDDNTLIARARADVAAGNGYEVRICCVQATHRVKLRIETWTGEPPTPEGWEGRRDLRMELPTGQLVISEGTMGARCVTVPTGDHHARVFYRGREETRGTTSSPAQENELSWQEGGEGLEGTEEYLVRLWPETPSHHVP